MVDGDGGLWSLSVDDGALGDGGTTGTSLWDDKVGDGKVDNYIF